MKKEKEEYVTCPVPKKYTKRKHIVCVSTRICNHFGTSPSEKCTEAKCPYARVHDYVCDITPMGYYRGMKFEDLGI